MLFEGAKKEMWRGEEEDWQIWENGKGQFGQDLPGKEGTFK
jgi:hypothetical protein